VGPPSEECTVADLDSDEDVDQSDLGLLQICLAGSDVLPPPACLEDPPAAVGLQAPAPVGAPLDADDAAIPRIQFSIRR
jgi:hypothetical protein